MRKASVELAVAGEAAVEGLDRRWCSVPSFVLPERPPSLPHLGSSLVSSKQTSHQPAAL